MIRIELEVCECNDGNVEIGCRSFASPFAEVTELERDAADKLYGAVSMASRIVADSLGRVKEFVGKDVEKARAE